jgi:hypothetical protein
MDHLSTLNEILDLAAAERAARQRVRVARHLNPAIDAHALASRKLFEVLDRALDAREAGQRRTG